VAEQSSRKNHLRSGTFTRRARRTEAAATDAQVPLGTTSMKRGTKQVWLPVEVRVIGDPSDQGGKRQRTASVFDRLEDPTNPSADLAGQGRLDQ
jgi:ATP-dependent protease HslVU (ClpYQ) peptidase subunit